jgi:hypothetical protein
MFPKEFINQVSTIVIIRTNPEEDHINIRLENIKSSFPYEGSEYHPTLRLETQKGYAEQWLKEVGFDGRLAEIVGEDYIESVVI